MKISIFGNKKPRPFNVIEYDSQSFLGQCWYIQKGRAQTSISLFVISQTICRRTRVFEEDFIFFFFQNLSHGMQSNWNCFLKYL